MLENNKCYSIIVEHVKQKEFQMLSKRLVKTDKSQPTTVLNNRKSVPLQWSGYYIKKLEYLSNRVHRNEKLQKNYPPLHYCFSVGANDFVFRNYLRNSSTWASNPFFSSLNYYFTNTIGVSEWISYLSPLWNELKGLDTFESSSDILKVQCPENIIVLWVPESTPERNNYWDWSVHDVSDLFILRPLEYFNITRACAVP